MLHELLLALLGYTGDLIVDDRERRQSFSVPLPSDTPISDDCTFRLAPDISFLDPSDRDLIERLITLGFYYRELDRFATVSRNLSWIRSANAAAAASPLERCSELAKRKDERPSVYRRAIANGIVEILSVYRSSVLQIEQKLLSETLPILATVTQGLNKFFVLLPPLYELIVKIERDDIRGGQLLNLLHKRCHCGVPELQTCIQRLLWHGHQVMYNQLASWMVYGILQDQHGEFFIRRQEERDVEPAASQTDISKKLAHLSTDDTSLTDWHQGFHIYLDMLPQYIHMHVAESVLFAGKAIRVLRNPNTASRFHGAAANSQQTRSPVKIQGFTERYLFSKEMLEDSYVIREELLPQSEADKIESMLRDLKESSEFHKRSFECVVDSIRAISASHLWQLVVVRADLNGHLKALKDYFLLAKGDFFQCFLEESRKLMRLPPRQSTAEADLTVPFQLAASKTTSEEDKYFSKVSLRMPTLGMNVKSSLVDMSKARPSVGGNSGVSPSSVSAGLDGWDGFSLDYAVDWPLQLFFTQDVLSKYLKVFQYLLRLKRAQMELDKSWASVMQQDHTEYSKHLKKELKTKRQYLKPAWRVREHMAFLIRNLQFYIQVDVIESQWNVLQAHVQDCHDFTELVNHHQEQGSTIYRFDDPGRHLSLVLALMRHIVIKMIKPRWCFQRQHKHVCCAERYPTSDGRGRLAYVYAALSVQLIAKKLFTRFEPITRYLSALISQSFLDIGSVSRILDSIMKLCLQFCWTVENQDGSHTSELEQITEEFNKKSNSLYTILRSTRLAGSQRAPFLRRFLLRLNFNSFFEATARGVLNVVRPRPALPVLNQQ